MNYHFTNFRVTKTRKGYLTEIKKYKWSLFGLKKYWTHFISYSGLPDEPYYFKTREDAIKDVLREVKRRL